ncbi:MAG: glycosyltransferase family 92 protein [Selenomonadaceae bacterium]|nr:glycosyltransferase family 92 protein [Selenomonadaceae bacterium]
MLDKNLFPYDLAVVAIFKDEAPYLKEWLDYHLLAGVDHFYLYNNDSSDNFSEVLAPYAEANLVTLTNFPGKAMQVPAYIDALEKYRFTCRYMAFIDCDEFIYPKTDQSISEVVDEILSGDSRATALAINWQVFGSNNLESADYSKGVLERFTRRAPDDWTFLYETGNSGGNIHIKSLVNPRNVDCSFSPHYAIYFPGLKAINSNGTETYSAGSYPIVTDKIVINHYYVKSREEFFAKVKRGSAYRQINHKKISDFDIYDRNEIFDDGILNYRAARAEKFFLEDDEQKLQRVKKILVETLTQRSPFDAPKNFFVGKLEIFLTCRALAEMLNIKIDSRSAEEFALAWIYQTLVQAETLTQAEVYQFIRALPEILARPFPFCRKIKRLTQEVVIPTFSEELKVLQEWRDLFKMRQLQNFLRLIKI